MNTRLIITLLSAGSVALACGQVSHKDIARAVEVAPPEPTIAGAAAPKVNGNFAVGIEPHALRFALNVTNDGKKNIEVTFPDGQQYEFTVRDSADREVYRWGNGRMFTQSVQNRTIDGGDTMHINATAETTLPHGKYVAVATLRSSNFPITQRSHFELR